MRLCGHEAGGRGLNVGVRPGGPSVGKLTQLNCGYQAHRDSGRFFLSSLHEESFFASRMGRMPSPMSTAESAMDMISSKLNGHPLRLVVAHIWVIYDQPKIRYTLAELRFVPDAHQRGTDRKNVTPL